MCDRRPFIKEIDWDLVLINLLHRSENLDVRLGSLDRLRDDTAVSMTIGNVTLILYRILNYTTERSF